MSAPLAPSSSPAALAPRPAPSTAAIPSSKARRMQTKGRPSGRSRAAAGSANGSGADASPARQMHAILDMQGAGSRSNKKSSGSSSSRQQAAESALPPSVPAPSADFMAQLSMMYNWMSRSEAAATAAAAAPQQQQQQPLAQPKPRHAPRPARSPASSPSSSAPASRSQFVDSDSDAFSEGNETDIEEEDAHVKQKKAAAAGAVDSNSYSLSDEEPLPAVHVSRASPDIHSSQQLVACEFRQFGCESLVGSERGSADPHYHNSYAHHLALLTAKHAILASQKSQLAVDVEATKRHAEEANAQVERMQRKLAKKTDTIAHLRTKLKTQQAALQEAKLLRLNNVQELVSSYLDGGVPADAKALLRFQRKQIDQLKAQLKEKETLLTKVAEHIKSTNKNGEAAIPATATKATKPATAPAPSVPSGPLFKVPAPVPFDPLREAHAADAKRHRPLGGRNPKPVTSMPVLMTSEPLLPVVHPVLRGIAPILSPNQLMNLVTSLVTGQPPTIVYVNQGRAFGPRGDIFEQQQHQQQQQQHFRQQQQTTQQQPPQQQQAPRSSPVVISSSRGDTDEELEENLTFTPFSLVTPSGAINTFEEPVSDTPAVAPIGTHLGLQALCPELWRKKFIRMKGGNGGQEGGRA